MTYRSELERLATLTADEIDDACRGRRIAALITKSVDELMELSDLADDALIDGESDTASFYGQEASAWRETAQVLRTLRSDTSVGRAAGAA